MITGYDSTNLADIPVGAQLILYYLNGSWPASAAALARFPNAIKEGISVTPFANVGKWLDVETGDAFPWQAPDWIVMRRNAGQSDAGVYVQYEMWAATRNEFALRDIPEPNWWIALWDGQAVLLAGAIGKQYAANYPGTPYYSGGHYDKSVFNYVFGPGGGTIDGGFGTMTDLEIQNRFVAVLDAITGVREATNDLNGALFYPTTDATYGKFAKLFEDKVRAVVQQELAKLPPSSGGTPLNKINLTITGTGNGTIT